VKHYRSKLLLLFSTSHFLQFVCFKKQFEMAVSLMRIVAGCIREVMGSPIEKIRLLWTLVIKTQLKKLLLLDTSIILLSFYSNVHLNDKSQFWLFTFFYFLFDSATFFLFGWMMDRPMRTLFFFKDNVRSSWCKMSDRNWKKYSLKNCTCFEC